MKKMVLNGLVLLAFMMGAFFSACNKDEPNPVDTNQNDNDGGNDNQNDDNNENESDRQAYIDSVNAILSSEDNLSYGAAIVDNSSGTAKNLIDGDITTFWQPDASDLSDEKVWVVVNLKEKKKINEIVQYWLDGNKGITGYTIECNTGGNNYWYITYAHPFESLDTVTKADLLLPYNHNQFEKVKIIFNTKSDNSDFKLSELVAYSNDKAANPTNLALSGTIADKSSACGTCGAPDGGKAAYLIDGDMDTYWQPLSGDRKDDEKLWATIDLGSVQSFNLVSVTYRAEKSAVGVTEIFYSDDNSSWEKAYGPAPDKTHGASLMGFPSVSARYVKIVSSISDGGSATEKFREIKIYNIGKE